MNGTLRTPENVNIEDKKTNIESEKVNIQNSFTSKTASHVYKLLEEFGFRTVFERSEVEKLLALKPTRSTALLKKMAEKYEILF